MENTKKMKMTPQRAAILDFLDGNTNHPSAEDIFRGIKDRYPMMSLATVYNTIETMKKMDMLLELNIDDTRKRYDPNPRPHHHMICTRCKAVADIHVEFKLDVPEAIAQGYDITGNHVEFYGICPECQAKNTN